MFDAYVIEIQDEAAGIVARSGGGTFVFYASSHRYNALEGRAFNKVADAQRAAAEIWRRKRALNSASEHVSFSIT